MKSNKHDGIQIQYKFNFITNNYLIVNPSSPAKT